MLLGHSEEGRERASRIGAIYWIPSMCESFVYATLFNIHRNPAK